MRSLRSAIVAGVVTSGLLAAPAVADSFVVLAKKNFSADFATQVEAMGGKVVGFMPEIGVAVVDAPSREGLEGLAGIRSVAANPQVRFDLPREQGLTIDFSAAYANPPASGDNDPFFDFQWGMTAIDVAGAWNAGHRGAGVRVAVLDSGIARNHPEFAHNLNQALSTSFVPDEPYYTQTTAFNHGTHVAGIIAAGDNGMGTIGVAPEAEIVAVKVLSEFTGSGSFGGIVNGIYYAGLIGADVANMSLGASIPHNCTFDILDDDGNPTGETEHFPARDCAELFVATGRAATFARQQGTLLIASAGNDYRDLNHDASDKKIPSEIQGVTSIAATGPFAWAYDTSGFLDYPSSYSNYGQSGVQFAAPGGDFIYPGNEACTLKGVTIPCWAFDMVISTTPTGWTWTAGTSMAAPHAAGVAALIIGKNGGSMDPAHVLSVMRQSADDLGKPGKDEYYGNGRVNAARAVAD